MLKEKRIVLLVLVILAMVLSGCILSKTPSTNDVNMNPGDQIKFCINIFPPNSTYVWTLDGSLLSNAEKCYTYTAEAGEHILSVKAKQALGTDTQTWNITTPSPPVANAGHDQTVAINAMVTLNGSGSTDPDNDIVSYQWQQTDGPTVTLINADSAIAQFTSVVAIGSVLTFNLTVTDAGGLTSTDKCMISVEEEEHDIITGHGVIHMGVEGGCWLIVEEWGSAFNPINLPNEFKKDGLGCWDL